MSGDEAAGTSPTGPHEGEGDTGAEQRETDPDTGLEPGADLTARVGEGLTEPGPPTDPDHPTG